MFIECFSHPRHVPGCLGSISEQVNCEPCSLSLKMLSVTEKENTDEGKQLRGDAEITRYLLLNFNFSLYIFTIGNGGK